MTIRQLVYAALLAPFLTLTAYVVATDGLHGFAREALSSPSTVLMGLDLLIALGLILFWMRGDARATGTPFWPYLAVTLVLGVAGPLLYGLHREARSRAGSRRAAAMARGSTAGRAPTVS